jgi:tRNA-specific 2-thiouridylase
MENKNKTALIAMSGGVDSSVSAALMREAGFDCIGATMKLYSDDSLNTCSTPDSVEDERRVAESLGMPFYVFDFTEDFDSHVRMFLNWFLFHQHINHASSI